MFVHVCVLCGLQVACLEQTMKGKRIDNRPPDNPTTGRVVKWTSERVLEYIGIFKDVRRGKETFLCVWVWMIIFIQFYIHLC